MKKTLPAPIVQDQVVWPRAGKKRDAAKSPPFVTRPDPTLQRKHRSVSYLPGEKPRNDPAVLPRLFIRGHGGSIKVDLGGVGIRFSEAVFAHYVADDSLRSLHVCRGDIALVEPAVRRVHDGNLLLLELDGHPVIRRLRRHKLLWMLNQVDGSADDLVLPANQGIQGVVIGFVRLYNKLRIVRYKGTDAIYSTGLEIPARPRKRRGQAAFREDPRSRVRSDRSHPGTRRFYVDEVGKRNAPLLL